MIAIKRRFAYYANPHHDQGFWVRTSTHLLEGHPWLTLIPRHATDNNPCQDGDWWWTVVPSSRSCKFDYKSRPKFKTAKKTRSIRAHSDSEDVWAGASTPSPSGDDAEGDGLDTGDRDSEDVWADASTPSPSGDDAEGHDPGRPKAEHRPRRARRRRMAEPGIDS
ncbi:hypothetical protein JB92DRAFT_2996440 [Gautieria morchelliformis]|nr:hypothetical protein JB92DRAFT_2996440 [Gautieria morchelliformis]